MNNVKDINQIPAKIYDEFDNGQPMFAVKAIIRNQQGQYQNARMLVDNLDDLYLHIGQDHVIRVRVWKDGQLYENEAILKQKAKEFKELKEKEKRLAQYKELHKEFGETILAEEIIN